MFGRDRGWGEEEDGKSKRGQGGKKEGEGEREIRGTEREEIAGDERRRQERGGGFKWMTWNVQRLSMRINNREAEEGGGEDSGGRVGVSVVVRDTRGERRSNMARR